MEFKTWKKKFLVVQFKSSKTLAVVPNKWADQTRGKTIVKWPSSKEACDLPSVITGDVDPSPSWRGYQVEVLGSSSKYIQRLEEDPNRHMFLLKSR